MLMALRPSESPRKGGCAQFHGLRGDGFLVHLKEYEIQYSSRGADLLGSLPNLVK
jgi:hypothetical protein